MTDRNVRSLIKIWSCDDLSIDDDLAELHRRLCSSARGQELVGKLLVGGDQEHDADTNVPALGDIEQLAGPSLVSLLAVKSVEPVIDLPSPVYDDGEVLDGVEAGCECSVSEILKSLTVNFE